MTCINLKERFGDRLKVVYEESYYADRGENARAEAPWYMILLCQNGHISPWDDKRLAACTSRPGSVAKRLKALPFAETVQDGDDGANIVFHVDHFAEVAKIMRPRKRKRLSEEHKRKLAEANAPYRFRPASQAANSDQTSVPEVALV
jgi:hypothetical protein